MSYFLMIFGSILLFWLGFSIACMLSGSDKGVMCKPLEWNDGFGCWTSFSEVGIYRIYPVADSRFLVNLNGSPIGANDAGYATLDLAMDVAQANHDARVISRLISA